VGVPTVRAQALRPGVRLWERHRWATLTGAFAVLSLASRASSLRAPIGEDTAGYLYMGQTILHGGMPYVDAAEPKGPMTDLLFAAIYAVSQHSAVALRLTLFVAAVLAALLLARYVARLAGMRAGVLAGALFATLGSTIALDGYDPNTEQYGVTVMVAAWLCASVETTAAALAAGALVAAATLMNPGFLSIVVIVAYELWRSRADTGWRAVVNALLLMLAGAVALAAPVLLWLDLGGALHDMKVQVWDYARTAAAAHLTSSPPPTSPTDLRFLFNVPAGSLWVLGAVGAMVGIWSGGGLRRVGGSALVWIVVAWLRAKSNHGFEWTHHYYVGVPGIVVGLAVGVDALLRESKRHGRVAILVMTLTLPLWIYVIGPQWREWALPSYARAGGQRFSIAYPMASVIRRTTPRGSPIFVAGSEAEVYWVSRRRAPTRWFVNYGLFARPDYARERARDLRRTPPAAIAVVAPETLTDVSDDVQRLVTDLHYRVVFQNPGGTVWVRPDLLPKQGRGRG